LKLRLKQHYSFKGQLRDFTHQEVTKKLRKIPTNSEHDHALSVGKTFFNWAYNRRYITDNPIRGISFYGSASRKRILTDHELKNIWDACAEDSLPQSFRAIVKMLILSGLRRTECALIQTSYIRENLLTLPGTITKNGLEHLLPIGPIASAFIASTLEANKRLHNSQPSSPYLFPGKIQGRPFSGWSKAKKSLDKLCGVKAWRLHDLRRTFRTNLGKLGVAPHIAERLVNHISARSDMEQTYDIWTYLPEMRSAMLLYEQHLSALLSGSRTEGFAPDLEKNTSG